VEAVDSVAGIRDHRRRNGKIEFHDVINASDKKKKDQRIIWGPYTLDFRKEILKRLLEAQRQVQEDGPDKSTELIQQAELVKIRQLWLHEEGDWEDSLPAIYSTATGKEYDTEDADFTGVGKTELSLLKEVADEAGLPAHMMRELLDVERQHSSMTRRAGIYNKIESVLNKDWRDYDEVLSKTQNQPGIKK